MGRQHQEMARPGVRQVPEGSGEQGKIEETGCEIICSASTSFAVKGIDDDGDDRLALLRGEAQLSFYYSYCY